MNLAQKIILLVLTLAVVVSLGLAKREPRFTFGVLSGVMLGIALAEIIR